MRYGVVRQGLTVVGLLALLVTAGCAFETPQAVGYGTSTPPRRALAAATTAIPDRTTVPPTAAHYQSVRQLDLRTGPNIGFETRRVLPAGTVITPNGYVSGGWWQVDTQYGTGWINSRQLRTS